MSKLKLVKHEATQRDIIEVWDENTFIATIYPHDRGVRVISRHQINTEDDRSPPYPGCGRPGPPNALVVKIGR